MKLKTLTAGLILSVSLYSANAVHAQSINENDEAKNVPIATLKSELNAKTKVCGSVQDNQIYDGVQAAIDKYLNDGSEYSAYLLYPQKTSTPFLYNSKKWRSASMIKVFMLAKVMEMVRDGELSLEQYLTIDAANQVGGSGILGGYAPGTQLRLKKILELMITESDNVATNMIIDLVGMDNLNEYIRRNNYGDTILQRKMMDSEAVAAGRENYTSVKDLGEIFYKIYNHQCVSPEYDDIMLLYLTNQHDTDCFNTALPGLKIAHKTGGLDGSFDDGGIIYGSQAGDFILILMSENFMGEDIVIPNMRKVAYFAATK